MDVRKTIQAWKDEDYRGTLSAQDLTEIQETPVGVVELDEADLEFIGGGDTESFFTLGCCPASTGCSIVCTWWFC